MTTLFRTETCDHNCQSYTLSHGSDVWINIDILVIEVGPLTVSTPHFYNLCFDIAHRKSDIMPAIAKQIKCLVMILGSLVLVCWITLVQAFPCVRDEDIKSC